MKTVDFISNWISICFWGCRACCPMDQSKREVVDMYEATRESECLFLGNRYTRLNSGNLNFPRTASSLPVHLFGFREFGLNSCDTLSVLSISSWKSMYERVRWISFLPDFLENLNEITKYRNMLVIISRNQQISSIYSGAIERALRCGEIQVASSRNSPVSLSLLILAKTYEFGSQNR